MKYMKYMKYLMKAFLHWLCIYAGLILIQWVLFAILAVEMDGSYMWNEIDFWAIKALALIMSLYVTNSVVEAYELAASIVPCRDCDYLSPIVGIDLDKAENDDWVGSCHYVGPHMVKAGEYCIHGKERERHEKSRRG